MPKNVKTIIIGLDGTPYDMIEDFAQSGVMPNMAELIGQGIFKKMQSSIPEISSVAWSSVITGKNPAEHGIFGFMDLFDGTYKMRFPNFNDLKARPFWEDWPGQSVIVNVPSTYPVRQMNGVHVSGFVSINFEKSVHPKSLIPQLQELDYRLDVDSAKAHSSMELFLSDLDATLDARIEAYRHLWDNVDWQTFMLVFTGTDRLMHFLWDAYEDKDHKYHGSFLDHFRKVDEAIGDLVERMDDEDVLIMLSDHGFERLEKDVYINHVLVEEGFLQFKDNRPALANIASATKAFALDPARIYLNLKDKYPSGNVAVQDKKRIINDLVDLFDRFEVNGRRVIKSIYRKEEIYSGPYLDRSADIILLSNQGFNLRASIKASESADKTIFTGKHAHDTAFFLVRNDREEKAIPENLRVEDVRDISENIVQARC